MKNIFLRRICCSKFLVQTGVIPDEDQHHDLKVVNQLGYAYATSPDSPEKEEKLLRLLECFHGYLMKYVVMIVRGTIPLAHSRAGKHARSFYGR